MVPVPERNELWRRLFAGELSEIFVLGCALSVVLPQTLGLEPICYQAYRYTADGMPRAGDELERLARELAASPRWIAQGDAPAWAPAFMDQAKAVLLYELYSRFGYVDTGDDPPVAVTAIVKDRIHEWFARRRRPAEPEGELGELLTQNARVGRQRDNLTELVELARARYPEKLLRVFSTGQRRQLRALRIPRQR